VGRKMSVPFIDRRIDSQSAPRQFTLRGLFVFMFACAAYLSTLMTVVRSPVISYDEPRGSIWLSMLIGLTWGLFYILYRKWGLRHALLIHCTGPVFCLGLLILGGTLTVLGHLIERPLTVPNFHEWLGSALRILCYALSYSAAASTLVSFPMSILMMLYLGLRRRPRSTVPPRSDP
jgi:hypothetical protein